MPAASPSSEGNIGMITLDVERPMLPQKKNSLYAFAQKGLSGNEEQLQLSKSGVYRFMPEACRSQYADPQQETLYKKYYTSQKQGDLVAFVMTALCWQVYCAIFYAARGLSLDNPKELAALVFLIMAFIVNCVVVGVYKLQAVEMRKQRLIKQVVPVAVFALLYANFFLDLASTHRPLLKSVGVSFQMLFVYTTITMLPLRLRYCALLATTSSVGVLLMHILLGKGRNQEVAAAAVLYFCSMCLGVLEAFVADKKQRRAFRQTRISIAMKLVVEQQALQQERLLLAVLPKHLVSEIRHDMGAIVHGMFKKMYVTRYENVSILFADIVGFTALSAKCQAAELVRLLNKLIARFDKLSEKYHQLRIKILGDCYYCISGAPEPRADHAVLCCHMGLSMVEAIQAVREETKSEVNMRVGIHTGSVLAGVMGQKQYAYDVYSKDTKLANAMESGGVPGRVHISEKTLACLNGEFEVEPGHGEQRNEDIRKAHLQTYLISKVVKPFPEGTLDMGKARISIQAEPLLTARRGSQRARSEMANHTEEPEEARFNDRLLSALIEREGATLKGKANYVTLTFNDPEYESQYLAMREKHGPALITANWLIIVFGCLAHGILWDWFNVGTGVAYGLAIGLTGVMTCLSWVAVKSKSFPAPIVKCIRWTETVAPFRFAWLAAFIVIAAVPEIADRIACTDPTSYHCHPPIFYMHLTTFLLLGITALMQFGHLHKMLIMGLLVIVHCVLTTVVQGEVFDKYDETDGNIEHLDDYLAFKTKYAACCMMVIILVALFWINRYSEVTSRLLFIWKNESDIQKDEAADLRRKNEELVYNILPPHVAKVFLGRKGDDDEPFSQDTEAGVMFASMPDFAEFYNEESVANQGIECLRFLNEVISDYDELLNDPRFSAITKIKTIGATYMVASGLNVIGNDEESDVERWRHLDTLVRFAFALQDKLNQLNDQSFNQFQLRIGIMHGPISAGVIGVRKPHFDIWGNTVNVASRMESTGSPSRIQVTEETMLLLKNYGYNFEPRGMVYVKGKGELNTFYLTK
ncbi:hypothetical protein RvY_15792 [Ramazzottius varieornatus]|uniref:adenylate cyclase n=1 Tax=Ramazzottius varieornatus TaxID=947166 RepID=A0A1D1VW58_RAMVA|nr:hypothetical protein RvY_15792 [Ramazzottius varieornatus]